MLACSAFILFLYNCFCFYGNFKFNGKSGNLASIALITETSLYRSNPKFAPNSIVEMGKIWGWYKKDEKWYFQYFFIKSYVEDVY